VNPIAKLDLAPVAEQQPVMALTHLAFAADPALGFASGGIIRTGAAALAALAANCSSIGYLEVLSCLL
jgi:hypothetical protein